jgi:hypothetical protein
VIIPNKKKIKNKETKNNVVDENMSADQGSEVKRNCRALGAWTSEEKWSQALSHH